MKSNLLKVFMGIISRSSSNLGGIVPRVAELWDFESEKMAKFLVSTILISNSLICGALSDWVSVLVECWKHF